MLMCGSDPVEDQNEDGSELGLTSNIEDMDVKVVQYHGDSRKVQRIFEVMKGIREVGMRVVSWNIRGFGSAVKRRAVQGVVHRQKCRLLFLQETKWEVIDATLVRKIWLSDTFGLLFCPTVGRSGGVLMVWGRGYFIMEESFIGGSFVWLSRRWVHEAWSCEMLGCMLRAMWRDMLLCGMIFDG
ncbi:hypothetical protein V6N11_058305 [Hibiscus sabdariffa]|uniref:Uncharacterized protein n=1 Tax=Hibiscus sabdariffa TaxID=183260 RepID=A0ABR2U4M5_9ROSI